MEALQALKGNFKSLSGAPRELWLVYVLKGLESYSYHSLFMILTLYMSDEFGMSDMAAGAFYGLYGVVCTFCGFCAGFVIDNLGVRASLMTGFTLLFIGRLISAMTTEIWLLKLCLCGIMPVGSAMGIPVLSLAIKRYTNETNRGVAFGLFLATMKIAELCSGVMVDALEIGVSDGLSIFGRHLSPRRLIILSGTLTTGLALLIACSFREIKVDSEGTEDEDGAAPVKDLLVNKVSPITIVRDLVSMPVFWKFMAITLICVNLKCSFRYLDALLPKYLVREFGKHVHKGMIFSIHPATTICVVIVVTAFTSNVGAYKMIQIGSWFMALAILPMCLSTQIYSSILYVVILSIGEAIVSPRFHDLSVSMAPEGREGTFVAMGCAPLFLAKLPVGFLSGWLIQRFCPKEGPRDSQTMWLVIFLILIPAPFLLSLFRPCLGNVGKSDDKKAIESNSDTESPEEVTSTDESTTDDSADSSVE